MPDDLIALMVQRNIALGDLLIDIAVLDQLALMMKSGAVVAP